MLHRLLSDWLWAFRQTSGEKSRQCHVDTLLPTFGAQLFLHRLDGRPEKSFDFVRLVQPVYFRHVFYPHV